MVNKILKGLTCLTLILYLSSVCYALTGNKVNVPVKISIPSQSILNVMVSKLVGTVWTPNQSSMDFGTLTFDAVNNIFRADCLYAVDVNAVTNGQDYTITHAISTVTNGSNDLNKNINVAFVKQINNDNDSPIAKWTYADSNGKTVNKATLGSGWLRVYYGIASGQDDAPGAEVIGASAISGTYNGTVTFTLTP